MWFSFKGRSCREFGLEYIPKSNALQIGLPNINVISTQPTYHHGGYYFGYNANPKEFTLECFAEEVQQETFERMLLWMMPGETGTLIFGDRPLVSYDVVVTSPPSVDTYPTLDAHKRSASSMLVTLSVTAYMPFGKLALTASDGSVTAEEARRYSGLLPSSVLPANDYTQQGLFLLHNPGSFECDTVIRIAGTAPNGVTIRNDTNGDSCKLLSLPDSPNYFELESETGRIRQLPAYPDKVVYDKHDDGFIRLAPSWPQTREVFVSYTDGSNTISFPIDTLTEDDEGLYILLNSKWFRIANVSGAHTATISSTAIGRTGSEKTTMTLMNELRVTATGGTLTELTISFTPYVR